MRTIKFRGKDVFTNAWRYGDLVHNKKVTTTGLEPRTMVDGYEVNPETVCQFTGLLDSTGREIYEGDTLSFPSTQYIVDGIPVRKQCYIRVVFDQGAFCAFDEIEQRISRPLGSYDKTVTSMWKVICNSSE